ncbi:MAG: hypothetical protein EOO48_12470 [Flavobacterium sp.]|nr:MAG: hypothetical protein EOO48_12470 [Flavobacterium sp.]
MNKIDLLYGALIAIAATTIGSWLFIELATPYGFTQGIQIMHAKGNLGKIITLGAILNLVAFFVLLKYKRELMARGVVLGTIILTVFTLLV